MNMVMTLCFPYEAQNFLISLPTFTFAKMIVFSVFSFWCNISVGIKVEAAGSSGTLASACKFTRRYNSEDKHRYLHCLEDL